MNSPNKLTELLDRAEAIKQEMSRLLVELENRATGEQPERPGHWRHHPQDWVRRHPPR